MSIKQHIIDGEQVLGHCSTDYWTWVCTDRRVLKYKQGKRGSEKLHDVSFSDISGISLSHEGRDIWYLIGAVSIGLLGILLSGAFGMIMWIIGTLVSLGIAAVLIIMWFGSEKSFFEFKGRGVIRQEPQQWMIHESAADNPDDVREFVKMVRGQLKI